MTRILVTEKLGVEGIEALRERFEVDVRLDLTPEQLEQALPGYEALVVRSQTKVTADLLAHGERLRVVGRAGTGVDNIDVDAATRAGIMVVNAPGANSVAAAELAIGMLLALARNIPQAYSSLAAGRWERNKYMGWEVRGKILGLLGFGRIGAEVARRARALEMTVLSYDPFISQERAQQLGVQAVTLETLLRDSDAISIHTPLIESTRNMINAERLAMMKRGAVLVNGARGGIVDEQALYEALESGHIAAAALDVWAEEPPANNPLVGHPRVIGLPHLGASTLEAQALASTDVADSVIDALEDRTPRYVVNAPFVAPEAWQIVAPYIELGRNLARMSAQLLRSPARSYEIVYSGDLAETSTEPIRLSILAGLLQGSTEQRVTPVNAALLARERGIHVGERKQPDSERYASLLELRVTSSDGSVTPFAGTAVQDEPHIVNILGYWLDLVPSEAMLFTLHRDRPGLIGHVGTILGANDINISSMHVGRLTPRGQAIMVLTVDEPVPPAVLAKIAAETGIDAAFGVEL